MTRLFLLLFTLCFACTPARKKIDGNIVRNVSFDGNSGWLSGHNNYQLRRQMRQSTSSFGLNTWPFIYTVKPAALKAELLKEDAYRLEVWYAHHGWFDAAVNGWEMRRIRAATPKRAGVVDIVGQIDPGPLSFVTAIEVQGLNKGLTTLSRAALRASYLRQGDAFNLEYAESARTQLMLTLRNHGRAYANVTKQIIASPDDQSVVVKLLADPGILTKIGAISVVGTDKVKEKYVRQILGLQEGESFSLEKLESARRRVFDMDTFSIVSVIPDTSDTSRADVPVEIRVTEGRFRTIRVGVGLDVDFPNVKPHVSAKLRDVHLFQQLMQFELGARAGLSYDLGDVSLSIDGLPYFVTWGVNTAIRYPRIAGQKVAIELSAEIEQNIFSTLWAYRRPEGDLAMIWRINDAVQLRIGPHAEQYEFLGDFGGRRNAQQRLFGVETDDNFKYQLTSMDLRLVFDWRDNPVRTTRGSYYSTSVRQAAKLTPSGYDFLAVTAEGRRFTPLRTSKTGFPLVLASRLRGQYILPLNDSQIPLPERAFLGGATSIRGFRSSQVGPYKSLLTYDEVPVRSGFLGLGPVVGTKERLQPYYIPSGGLFAGEASVELRYDWMYGVTFATFIDAGVLSPSLLEIQPSDFRGSAGVGARYDTLVGPIRLDVSFRPIYTEDEGPAGFRTCATEYNDGCRAYDLFSTFKSMRTIDQHPPFATVFFLTIGESI